jgi:group I intron endonuclease
MQTPTIIYNTGIYNILNTINLHFYAGSAVNLYNRWSIHKSDLNHNKHHCNHLQRAWNKYGENAFKYIHVKYTTLDALTPVWSEKHQCMVIQPEQDEIDKYWDSGILYNTCRIAGSRKGIKNSEEARKKSSESHKGLDNHQTGRTRTPEQNKKNSEAHKGHKDSEETKKKKSESKKGRDNHQTGRIQTEEHIRKRVASISKTWQITYPNGTIKIIKNLRKFCKENNLIPQCMGLVSQGKHKHHKGFKCKNLGTGGEGRTHMGPINLSLA